MNTSIKTSYYIEFFNEHGQWCKTAEFDDYFRGIDLIKNNFTSGRLVRKIIRTDELLEIVYPTMVEKYKGYSV